MDKFKFWNVNLIKIRRICSFLSNRRQRTKMSKITTDWLILNGTMSQGSWLGPVCFKALTNDLLASCIKHKIVNETTLSETLRGRDLSNMQFHLSFVSNWSECNSMKMNLKKTKEIVDARSIYNESCLPQEYNGFVLNGSPLSKVYGER